MKTRKSLLIIAVIIGLMLVGQQLLFADGIDVRQAQSMSKQGALLLDVREPEEFASVHIPNAHLIPISSLDSRLNEIDAYKNKPIVVICRTGHRSSLAVIKLKQAGYTNVSNVKGGITAWENEGLEVIRK